MREDVHDALRRPPREDPRHPQRDRPATSTGRRPTRPCSRSTGSTRDTPFVLFVGRITRQKGIIHLVNAIKDIRPGVQVVLCAGRPGHARRSAARWPRRSSGRGRESANADHLDPADASPRTRSSPLYTHAALFVCPSVYEPFGIINLEAMACETPVVASAVGGIKEVVVHGETGLLVAVGADRRRPTSSRSDPEQFARDLAAGVNALLDDPTAARDHGAEGAPARRRAFQLDQHRAPDARLLRDAGRRAHCPGTGSGSRNRAAPQCPVVRRAASRRSRAQVEDGRVRPA